MITDPVLRAAKEAQLKDATDAYHSLMTGTQARVVVDRNGERVEFNSANKQSLYAYILQLQGELGCISPAFRPSGPAMFVF